jgi:hypothetical protein
MKGKYQSHWSTRGWCWVVSSCIGGYLQVQKNEEKRNESAKKVFITRKSWQLVWIYQIPAILVNTFSPKNGICKTAKLKLIELIKKIFCNIVHFLVNFVKTCKPWLWLDYAESLGFLNNSDKFYSEQFMLTKISSSSISNQISTNFFDFSEWFLKNRMWM